MDLPRFAIPTICQDLASSFGGDCLGIRDSSVLEVGKCGALLDDATLFLTELVLLAVRSVPDVIEAKVRNGEESHEPCWPGVFSGIVGGNVENAMAVRQRYSSHIPEDQHEAELFVVHIPGGDDEVLTLCTSTGVQVMSEEQKDRLHRWLAVHLVLLKTSSERQEEQNEPWNANLEEHLEVQNAEQPRVQLGAEEEVHDRGSGHANSLATSQGRKVSNEGAQESRDDSYAHDMTELVNKSIQLEDASEMENERDDDAAVERPHGGAVVIKLLSTKMG